MLVGTFDTVMDIIVVIEWFGDDSIWWGLPAFILACIFLPGMYFVTIGLFTCIDDDCDCSSAGLSHSQMIVVTVGAMLGLSNFFFGALVMYDTSAINLEGFNVSRVLEIFIEAAPAGGVQLYHAIKNGTYDFGTSTMSIIASLISISLGMEETVGKYLPTLDRILIFFYSLCNFIFRVSSISIFISRHKWSEYTLVPSIFLVEWIIFYSNSIYSNGGLDYCLQGFAFRNIKNLVTAIKNYTSLSFPHNVFSNTYGCFFWTPILPTMGIKSICVC